MNTYEETTLTKHLQDLYYSSSFLWCKKEGFIFIKPKDIAIRLYVLGELDNISVTKNKL